MNYALCIKNYALKNNSRANCKCADIPKNPATRVGGKAKPRTPSSLDADSWGYCCHTIAKNITARHKKRQSDFVATLDIHSRFGSEGEIDSVVEDKTITKTRRKTVVDIIITRRMYLQRASIAVDKMAYKKPVRKPSVVRLGFQ